jgi:hypothetical protein
MTVGKDDRHQYGAITWRAKMIRAHRLSWEIANGVPIPDGLQVCHTCDNPPCVNPRHLWLGTNLQNVQDKVYKGRHRNAYGDAPGRGLEPQTCPMCGGAFLAEAWRMKRGRRYCTQSCANRASHFTYDQIAAFALAREQAA